MQNVLGMFGGLCGAHVDDEEVALLLTPAPQQPPQLEQRESGKSFGGSRLEWANLCGLALNLGFATQLTAILVCQS